MSVRGPRLEFAVGAFLLLALASLLVLALASSNGKFGFGQSTYPLKARFTNLGQLRPNAPVKIGGVNIGTVADIQLDPVKLDAVVTLAIDSRYKDLPSDTSAGILTGGLLGESYVGLQPGGDMEPLKPGDEIAFTTPAVDLIQMVGKYMFGGGGGDKPAAGGSDAAATPPSPTDAAPKE
ncbi:MAG TPA: outer membrane lipid asymmetry maintenance protein MlaD [Luteimonas sp.]|jgi:phospholipid/cholesterol/gamma-HCH transport system substrate-binding protein|nr:outer membrane lipid asymmetry maintenance protein MlaD [Luteimonas sp.]